MKKFFTAVFKFFALTAVFLVAYFLVSPILHFIPINLYVCSVNVTAFMIASIIAFTTKKLVFAK